MSSFKRLELRWRRTPVAWKRKRCINSQPSAIQGLECSFHVGGINRSFVLYSGRVQRSKGFEEKRFHSCSFSFSLSAHSQIQLWWGISRFSSHAGLFPGSGRQFPNPADSADGAFIADQHSVEYAGWRTHILWYNGRLFSLFVMPLLCSYLYDLF